MGSESFRKKINFQLLDHVGSFPKQHVNQTSCTTYDVEKKKKGWQAYITPTILEICLVAVVCKVFLHTRFWRT